MSCSTALFIRETYGCSSQRHLCIENLQTNFRPLSNGLKLYTTVDQALRKFSSVCSEGVCADDDGSGGFVGFEEGLGFARWEEVQKLLCKELRVAFSSC